MDTTSGGQEPEQNWHCILALWFLSNRASERRATAAIVWSAAGLSLGVASITAAISGVMHKPLDPGTLSTVKGVLASVTIVGALGRALHPTNSASIAVRAVAARYADSPAVWLVLSQLGELDYSTRQDVSRDVTDQLALVELHPSARVADLQRKTLRRVLSACAFTGPEKTAPEFCIALLDAVARLGSKREVRGVYRVLAASKRAGDCEAVSAAAVRCLAELELRIYTSNQTRLRLPRG